MPPFRHIADELIEKALETDDWSSLPGKGQPLDQSDCLSLPEDQRMGHTILKNSGFKPPEIDLYSELEQLKSLSNHSPIQQQRLIQLEIELALRREKLL